LYGNGNLCCSWNFRYSTVVINVADPNPFDTDPDPDRAVHFDTDPDPDPAFQFNTDPAAV
jgi:hypothetical protein